MKSRREVQTAGLGRELRKTFVAKSHDAMRCTGPRAMACEQQTGEIE